MDPLTHALAGAALGRAAARPLSGRPLALLVLLSLAPDADIVLSWISDVVYLKYHRGVTHSLLMLPLWIWLAHALLNRRTSRVPAWLIASAFAVHILLDLVTSFGTMIFAPLSDMRASLDAIFIIDVPLTLGMGLLLAGAMLARESRWPARLALAWMAGWLSLGLIMHARAMQLAEAAHPEAREIAALPLPFSPAHWQLVAGFSDRFERANVDLWPALSGSEPLFPEGFVARFLPKLDPPDRIRWQRFARPGAELARKGVPGLDFYLWFARFPVIVRRDVTRIELGDLRFGAGQPDVQSAFGFRIELKPRVRGVLVWHPGRETVLQ